MERIPTVGLVNDVPTPLWSINDNVLTAINGFLLDGVVHAAPDTSSVFMRSGLAVGFMSLSSTALATRDEK